MIDRRTRIAQCVSSKHLRTLFYSLLLLWLVAHGGARRFCEKRTHVPVRPAGAPPATSWVGSGPAGAREPVDPAATTAEARHGAAGS